MVRNVLAVLFLVTGSNSAFADDPAMRCILDDDGWFDLKLDLPARTAGLAERQVEIVSFDEEEMVLSGTADGDTITVKLNRASGDIEFIMISIGLPTYIQNGRCHGPTKF